MQLIKKISMIGVFSLAILTSCKKEDAESYYVKCKIDGVDFNATQIVYHNVANGNYVEATVNGYPQYLAFNLRDSNAEPVVSNYTLGPGQPVFLTLLDVGTGSGGYNTQNGTGSGNLNISEVTSTKVKGTFNGTLYYFADPAVYKTVTNGEFNVQRN